MTGGRWSVWVGGALVVVAAITLVVTVVRSGDDAQAPGVATGAPLPPFATPLVRSSLDGDANVAQRAEQGSAGRQPACAVRAPDILNGCALAESGPAVLTFVADVGDCLDGVRSVQELRLRRPDLDVAAVVMRGDRVELRRWLDRARITIPVGWDRDGVLGALYGVVSCPQTTIIDARGRVAATVYGPASRADLDRRLPPPTSLGN